MLYGKMKDAIVALETILNRIYQVDKEWKKRGKWKAGENGSILYPPATEKDINMFEKGCGKAFPPSYREFLLLHNGWSHFWLDFTLMGVTGKHTESVLHEVKETTKWQINTLRGRIGELTGPVVSEWEQTHPDRNLFLEKHFPFGTQFGGGFYVFDLSTRQPDGEMTIVYWTIGYGAWKDKRYRNFMDLIKKITDEAQEFLDKKSRKKRK